MTPLERALYLLAASITTDNRKQIFFICNVIAYIRTNAVVVRKMESISFGDFDSL